MKKSRGLYKIISFLVIGVALLLIPRGKTLLMAPIYK